MPDILCANGDIAINLHPTNSWASFVAFVRRVAIREFILFLIDDEGMLDASEVAASAHELIANGVVQIWLSGPHADALEQLFDDEIIAAEESQPVKNPDFTISTGVVCDDEKIAVFALSEDILEELGELRSVVIGVFRHDQASADSRASQLSEFIARELLEYEDDLDE